MNVKKGMLALLGICCFFLGGCAQFIVPEIGSIASEESWVIYNGGELQEGLLENKDLKLEYALSGEGEGVRFRGELRFDRSLTDSFPVIKTFKLKLNWLDDQGVVLQTVDITPLFGVRNFSPDRLPVNRTIAVAPGAAAFCFNYYGVFQGEKPDVTEEWDIFLFPFTAPAEKI